MEKRSSKQCSTGDAWKHTTLLLLALIVLGGLVSTMVKIKRGEAHASNGIEHLAVLEGTDNMHPQGNQFLGNEPERTTQTDAFIQPESDREGFRCIRRSCYRRSCRWKYTRPLCDTYSKRWDNFRSCRVCGMRRIPWCRPRQCYTVRSGCTADYQRDRRGWDMPGMPVTVRRIADCQNRCRQTKGCVCWAVNLITRHWKRCFLKSKCSPSVSRRNTFSGRCTSVAYKTNSPTNNPTAKPTERPTEKPTQFPTQSPVPRPSKSTGGVAIVIPTGNLESLRSGIGGRQASTTITFATRLQCAKPLVALGMVGFDNKRFHGFGFSMVALYETRGHNGVEVRFFAQGDEQHFRYDMAYFATCNSYIRMNRWNLRGQDGLRNSPYRTLLNCDGKGNRRVWVGMDDLSRALHNNIEVLVTSTEISGSIGNSGSGPMTVNIVEWCDGQISSKVLSTGTVDFVNLVSEQEQRKVVRFATKMICHPQITIAHLVTDVRRKDKEMKLFVGAMDVTPSSVVIRAKSWLGVDWNRVRVNYLAVCA